MSAISTSMRTRLVLSCAMVMALSGCTIDEAEHRRDVVDALKASDRHKVDVVFGEVKYFPFDLMDWAKERNLRGADAVFARADAADGCYILGPDNALSARKGSRFQGMVAVALVDEWPLEVFTLNPGCLPVRGKITFNPIEVEISPPRNITRSR